jgi:hypothetical protein
MHLRETRRHNKDGSVVSYLALGHNERDVDSGVPQARIIHNFGRTDQVDREGLARLVRSISRFLDPAEAAATSTGKVRILDARPMGTSWVLGQAVGAPGDRPSGHGSRGSNVTKNSDSWRGGRRKWDDRTFHRPNADRALFGTNRAIRVNPSQIQRWSRPNRAREAFQ